MVRSWGGTRSCALPRRYTSETKPCNAVKSRGKKSIFAKVRRVLRDDGYLFMGGTETTLFLDDTMDRVTIGKSAVYRPQGHLTTVRK
jgi:hypothetical protein